MADSYLAASSGNTNVFKSTNSYTTIGKNVEQGIVESGRYFQFKYSREQEYEADIVSYMFMEALGIGGDKLIDAFTKLGTQYDVYYNKASDHPKTADRIKVLKQLREHFNVNNSNAEEYRKRLNMYLKKAREYFDKDDYTNAATECYKLQDRISEDKDFVMCGITFNEVQEHNDALLAFNRVSYTYINNLGLYSAADLLKCAVESSMHSNDINAAEKYAQKMISKHSYLYEEAVCVGMLAVTYTNHKRESAAEDLVSTYMREYVKNKYQDETVLPFDCWGIGKRDDSIAYLFRILSLVKPINEKYYTILGAAWGDSFSQKQCRKNDWKYNANNVGMRLNNKW